MNSKKDILKIILETNILKSDFEREFKHLIIYSKAENENINVGNPSRANVFYTKYN